MPRIIIFAPVRQDAVLWYSEQLSKADPEGVVIVTADFNLEHATAILEQMQTLADEPTAEQSK